MIRALQVLFVIAAAVVCAACSVPEKLRLAAKRHEVRMVLIDWGVNAYE